jgi:hypothetical protein
MTLKLKYILILLLLVECNENHTNKKVSDYMIASVGFMEESVDSDKITMKYQKNDTLKCNCVNGGQLLFIIMSDTAISIKRIFQNHDTILRQIGGFSEDFCYIESNYLLFKYSGNVFFKAQITERGTGNYNTDELYYIDKMKCDVKHVKIDYSPYYYMKYLKDNEVIWKGESRNYEDDNINGNFYIWNDTDANCCPSVGEVNVVYKINKINDDFIMRPDTNTFKFEKYED